jgi:hypothetical protein
MSLAEWSSAQPIDLRSATTAMAAGVEEEEVGKSWTRQIGRGW